MSAMLGDSFSASSHVVVPNVARAKDIFTGGRLVETSAASSRVDAAGCRDLADCSSISSPMTMVAGITQAAAAMMMRSPTQVCSGEFENSPISVLQGLGEEIYTPSPTPMGNSVCEVGDVMGNLVAFLNDASSHNNEVEISRPSQSDVSDGVESFRLPLLKIRAFGKSSQNNEVEISRPAQSDVSDGVESFRLPLLKTRAFGKPPLSEESVSCGSGRFRRIERCKSSSESINKEEEVGELEVQGVKTSDIKTVDEDEEPESPTTPSSAPRPLVLECPDAPCGRCVFAVAVRDWFHARRSPSRSKELNRQSSLNDTKLLMTTHLKRSASIFMFDKHFEFLREIGRGSFSTVYEARDRRNGSHCAVKMSKRQFRGKDDRDHYLREIQSVACLSEHVNVVKYFRSWQQQSHFYIQMELCESGSLRNLLDSSPGPLPESQVWNFINQVASGLEHIHARGVLHLDIKPENIFVDSQGVLKIGDFGLAVPCHLWEWEEGDGGYVAPELLREEEPGTAADMYSFGAMVYEWATHTKLPRSGPLREGNIDLPETRTRTLENLVRGLLHPNPSKRPTATEVIKWREKHENEVLVKRTK